MYCRAAFVSFVIALMAGSTNAALMPRQETSSTAIATSSDSIAPLTSSTTPETSVTSSPTPTITSASSASSVSSAQPFVSVESGGSITTVTPSGTTSIVLSPTGTFSVNGTNTTISACTPDNYALGGAAQPFCAPVNGSAWIKNTSYPVTWNPDFWPGYTGNVVLALLYTGSDGSNVIFQNKDIANSQGYFVVDVSEDWLNGKELVAAKLLIAPSDPTANGGAHWGPIVTLQVSDHPFDTPSKKTNLAIAIAVPLSVVGLLLLLCGVCYCTRKQRALPQGLRIPRNGGKRKGYAVGKSRRKRTMGVEKLNDDDAFEMGTVSGYRDEPVEVYSDIPAAEERRH